MTMAAVDCRYQVRFYISVSASPGKHVIVANLFEKHRDYQRLISAGTACNVFCYYGNACVNLSMPMLPEVALKYFKELTQCCMEYRIEGGDVHVSINA